MFAHPPNYALVGALVGHTSFKTWVWGLKSNHSVMASVVMCRSAVRMRCVNVQPALQREPSAETCSRNTVMSVALQQRCGTVMCRR